MKYRCLTNNPYIIENYKNQVESFDGTPLELFIRVKEEVLKGYKLITHPLTGSIGPHVNPYKSIIMETPKVTIDEDSLHLIDCTIRYTQNLLKDNTNCHWDFKSKQDFQDLDFDFVKRFLF